MFTRFYNLGLASVTTLFVLLDVIEFADDLDYQFILFAVITPFWLAGAIGLLFKRRLAWCGSLLGAGTLFCGSFTMLISGAALLPVAQDPTDGIGYLLIFGVFGMLLSLPLIIGLIRLRKNLFSGGSQIPTPSPA